MGLPVIAASSDLDSPAPVIIYTPTYGSDASKGPQSWSEDIAFASQFRLIHQVQLIPGSNGDLDAVLVSGREGVILLYFNERSKEWVYNIIGTGLPREGDSPYWGAGGAHTASVAGDSVGYIASCEVCGPFLTLVSILIDVNTGIPRKHRFGVYQELRSAQGNCSSQGKGLEARRD